MPKAIVYIFLVFTVSACLAPEVEPTAVSTEDIIYTSGEKMVITGRILATTSVELSDHGFLISKDENFSSPITLGLGERTSPGRFVGEFDDLEVDQAYFVKSYVQDVDGLKEGNVLEFNTLLPIIDDFYPRVAAPNSQLLIEGRNFTKDAKVFIGDREATVVSRADESFIVVNTPPIAGNVFEELVVQIDGQDYSPSFPFEYVIGTWNKGKQFVNDDNFIDGVSFRQGNKIIFGLGAPNGFGPYTNKINTYDIESEEWGSIPFIGPGLAHSFACEGFLGSGSSSFVRPTDNNYTLIDDLFRLNEEGSFVYDGTLPFRLLKASAQRIGDFIYVFGGFDEDIEANLNIYIYDIEKEEWTQGESLRSDAITNSDFPSFNYNGNVYFAGSDQIIYQYAVGSGLTTAIAEYPATISKNGLAEVIGDKAYIGVFDDKRLLYEFDLNTYEFKEKTGFKGQVREAVIASWVQNDKLYLKKNNIDSDERLVVWSFSPEEF